MAENNVIYTVVTPDVPKAIPGEQLYVYVPQASFTNPGIAKFNKEEFTISADGLVSLVGKFIREEELNKEQFIVSETGAVSIKDEYIREQAFADISDALAKKLDKATEKTDYDEAYVKDASGTTQKTVPSALLNKPNTIAKRDGGGSLLVSDAISDYEAVPLHQVTELIDEEASKRDSADTALDAKITAEASAREQADSTLQDNIDKKLDATAVVQETGTAEDKVISQKVVTEKLNGKLDVKNSKQCVYAVNQVREQEMVKYSEYVYPFSIAYRNENGELAVADATLNESAVSLGQLVAKLLGYLPTSGGTISNDLAIQGNLTVRGTTTTTIEETLNVKDAIVVANADAADITATLAGFIVRVHAEDCYGIVYDFSSNSIKLGLGMIADGKFVFYEGEGNAVAVRSDGSLMTNGHLVKWDATALKFVDAGKSVDDIKSDTLAALTEGDNISIVKAADSEKVTISATGLVKHNTDLSSGADLVYGQTYNGADISYQIGQNSNSENTIARRTSYGSIRTADPQQYNDAVNKQYFEANGAMQRIIYSSDNKTISPTELALLKPGFYTINASYTITNGTDSLPKDYYTMIKQGGIDDVPYNDSTYLFQSYGGTVYAYSQYGASGYENKSAFYKLATTDDVATATAVLIDNSLLGG